MSGPHDDTWEERDAFGSKTVTALPGGGEEHVWDTPRPWGLWVRFDPEDFAGVGCEWGLGSPERFPCHDECDHLVAEFVTSSYLEARRIMDSLSGWARADLLGTK